MAETVNHPSYYGGENNPYEAIKVIEAWGLDFSLGNAVKYISRAGYKNPETEIEDLEKAVWYLNHYIETLKGQQEKKREETIRSYPYGYSEAMAPAKYHGFTKEDGTRFEVK